jgi:O-antigen/teichoic acid export membrane protein
MKVSPAAGTGTVTSVRRSAFTTLLFQWGSYVLQLVSLVVLARILLPADYGLITMAAAVIGIAAVIGDFGLSLAAIQAPQLSQQQKANLFWLNTGIGTGVGVVVIAVSPLIAAFYDEPRLVPVTAVLGSVFAFNGAAVQFKVELNRAARFRALGTVDLGSQAIGLLVAIVLGAIGFGYWALVAQQFIAAVAALVLAAALARWRPTRPGAMSETRHLLTFGRDTLLLQVTNYVTSNIDSVMVGRWSGPVSLGIYNRAYQITVLPILQVVAPLTRVFLPRLAAAAEDEREFVELLGRLQLIIVYVTIAPLSLLCALSDSLPVVVFGPQWRPLADVVPILAISAFFGILGYIYYWAFLAKARTMTLFLAEIGGRIPMAAAIVALAPLGPQWVAGSVAFGQMLIWALSTFVFGRRIGVAPGPMLRTAARPVAMFVLALLAGLALRWATVGESVPLVAIVVTLAGWCAVVAACLAFRPFRSDVRAIVANVRPARSS